MIASEIGGRGESLGWSEPNEEPPELTDVEQKLYRSVQLKARTLEPVSPYDEATEKKQWAEFVETLNDEEKDVIHKRDARNEYFRRLKRSNNK
jgi:hypothetical protein